MARFSSLIGQEGTGRRKELVTGNWCARRLSVVSRFGGHSREYEARLKRRRRGGASYMDDCLADPPVWT